MKNFNQKKLEKFLKELEQEIHEVETLIKTAKSGGGEESLNDQMEQAGALSAAGAAVAGAKGAAGAADEDDEDEDGGMELVPFDDQIFKTVFDYSLKNWVQDCNSALNALQGYFNSGGEAKGGISISDVLKVVSLITFAFPPAKIYMAVAQIVATMVEKAVKASMPKQVEMADLHAKCTAAFDAYGNQSHEAEFQEFVKQYKAINKMGADVGATPKDPFLKACGTYAQHHLADKKTVQKAFLSKLLGQIPDSYDIGGGMEDGTDSGFARVDLRDLAWHFISGDIDDIGPKLMKAVTTIYGTSNVIDLPIPIRFKIYNVMSAHLLTVERTSRKSGSTAFKFTDGDRGLYKKFMKEGGWKTTKVSSLTYDK